MEVGGLRKEGEREKTEVTETRREKKKESKKERIVAKALDGQRYPLPLSECMRV